MHEAKFYNKGKSNTVKCVLCPHRCIIKDGKYGKCKARLNKAGVLYSENYGRVTGLSYDPVEKKPLYHFYPGRQIQSVGTYGCNLHCEFCQNYHISQVCIKDLLSSRYMSPEDIILLTLKNNTCCGISYTYNEPATWYEYMMNIAVQAKKAGMANAVVSNGYINPEPLEMLMDITDAFNIDLKAFDDDFYRKFTGSTLKPVKRTIKTIAERNIHLEITNLILPGLNDDVQTFERFTQWVADELGPDIPLHINRYFPSYKMTIDPTPIEKITMLRKKAMDKLNFVYCGNVSSLYGSSDTICPKCKNTVIQRADYKTFTEGIDNKGNCIHCNYRITVC